MWPPALVLVGVVLAYHQVVGGEVPDVTTLYEVGKSDAVKGSLINQETNVTKALHGDKPVTDSQATFPWIPLRETSCISGVIGHVHSRTNALGMGFVDKRNNFIDIANKDLPNITFDATEYTSSNNAQWTLSNESLWNEIGDQTKIIITLGTTYNTSRGMTFKIQDMNQNLKIFFTKGPSDLKHEKVPFMVYLYGESRESPKVYYDCDDDYGTSDCFEGYRDGIRSAVCCKRYLDQFEISYENDYLTFDFTQGIKVYRQMGKTRVLDWSNGAYQDIKYFSVSLYAGGHSSGDSLISLLKPGLKVDQEGIVSPVFTPQSNDLCLAILLHSTAASLSSVLGISVMGSEDNEYSLASIQNVKSGWNVKVVNQKLRDTSKINIKIKKTGMANINIARITTCNAEGEEVLELPVPISVCRNDRTLSAYTASSLELFTTASDYLDPVEKVTDDISKKCWNGGELTTGGCACPPGFIGSSCEIGCGRNRFGQDCEGLCSLHTEECKGLLMCTKFTGCHCAPGFTGTDCTEACSPGWYGNDCLQKCNHCAGNSSCDIYTGECASCEEGFLGPQCKFKSAYYGSKPEVTSPSYGTIVVTFDPTKYVSVSKPPQLYQIQYRKKGEQWQVYTTKLFQNVSEDFGRESKISETIEGLKIGVVYQVRILMMDDNLMKYDGDLVQQAELRTKCNVPSFYDYKLTSTANISSIVFSWKFIINDIDSCPLETFEVTWKEGWKWPKNYTTDQSFTLFGLRPGAVVKFKVRAITTGGSVPYSNTVIASTLQNRLPSVQNLRVESRHSTSVDISWDPPIGFRNRRLRYMILYKCVDRPACSLGCQNVTEGQLTQEGTSLSLSSLLPFTKYLATVKAEGGAESSIFVGTAKIVPMEVPVLSARRPLKTNTSVTVFWDPVPVCSGYLLGYNYQLTKASENLKILASGFTKETNASFHNLTASTEYVVKVFVYTISGWNPLSYLSININTSATVPEAVRNLTVYKRGRGMLGLRWAEPRATYGRLKSFTVTHSLGQEVVSHTVEPARCVVWPDLYCHTVEGLRSNRRYNVTVSARNMEVSEDGEPATVTSITKESSPAAPVNLGLINSTSTSVVLQWGHPDQVNGVLRSFLVSIEETEKFDQESCCQVYPFVETAAKDEYQYYDVEVSGLHPASTYFVSVSAKTVGLGPSQPLVVYTRPPHLPLTVVPGILPSSLAVSWQPQDKPTEVNNSDVYSPLIRAHLLLAVLNETQLDMHESGIIDPKLGSLLQHSIEKPFFFITEYNQEDYVDLTAPLEDIESPWGRPPVSLSPEVSYQLAATQVLEYNGAYNVDIRYSQPFTLQN